MTSSHNNCALGAAVLVLLLCGCATQEPLRPSLYWSSYAERRIVIFPPDVAMNLVTVSGAIEPQADRTQSARAHLVSNLTTALSRIGIAATALDNLADRNEAQAAKYYSVYSEEPPPGVVPEAEPAAKPDTATLSERYKADYALFFHLHDFSTSTGREVLRTGIQVVTTTASAVASLAASGGRLLVIGSASPSGSRRVAVVSIVDLHTGKVVWSETELDTDGDLWEEDDNRDFVEAVLKDAPF